MNMKKVLAMMLAVLMIVTATVAGTVAWLTTSTQEVKNTFTTSDINITLEETNVDGNSATENSYKMVPGATIDKDPKVTVVAGSEDCYLFVEVTEVNDVDTYLAYTIDGGWTALEGVAGVYWRKVTSSTSNQDFIVLGNGSYKDSMGTDTDTTDDVTITWSTNKLGVKPSVTKAMMNSLSETNYPRLTFKAYAVQSANLTDQNGDSAVDAKDAWALRPTA